VRYEGLAYIWRTEEETHDRGRIRSREAALRTHWTRGPESCRCKSHRSRQGTSWTWVDGIRPAAPAGWNWTMVKVLWRDGRLDNKWT